MEQTEVLPKRSSVSMEGDAALGPNMQRFCDRRDDQGGAGVDEDVVYRQPQVGLVRPVRQRPHLHPQHQHQGRCGMPIGKGELPSGDCASPSGGRRLPRRADAGPLCHPSKTEKQAASAGQPRQAHFAQQGVSTPDRGMIRAATSLAERAASDRGMIRGAVCSRRTYQLGQ